MHFTFQTSIACVDSDGSRLLDGGGGGGGGGHPDPEIRGGAVLKKVFSALRASVWSKSKGGAGLPRAPPLNPPLVEADPPIV